MYEVYSEDSEKKKLHCYFVRHKYRMYWTGKL